MRLLNSVLASSFLSLSLMGQANINMGMVGDSMTDEYLLPPNLARTDLAAYSWVEILDKTRGNIFNFGEYRHTDNYWPDNRDAGFEYNWAKVGGAISNESAVQIMRFFHMPIDTWPMKSAYVSSQVEGVSELIKAGKIQYMYVGAGSNDFFYQTTNMGITGATPIKKPDLSDAYLDSIVNSTFSNIDALQKAGEVKIILALIPLGTAQEGGGAEEVLAAIIKANNKMKVEADKRGIPTFDLFGFSIEPGRVNEDGSVNIGDKVLKLGSVATDSDLIPNGTSGAGKCNSNKQCAGPTHADKYIAEDKLHPNTAIQGLIANQVLRTLNTAYNLDIELLKDDEILALTMNQ